MENNIKWKGSINLKSNLRGLVKVEHDYIVVMGFEQEKEEFKNQPVRPWFVSDFVENEGEDCTEEN